jgi:transcriptional regulator with XRE-family HTH domain
VGDAGQDDEYGPDTWVAYVRHTVGDDSQSIIARKTGIDQTTVSRWYSGERRALTIGSVTRFARGYKRPVLEALVQAGLITAKDARVRVVQTPLTKVPISELAAEIARRASATAGKAS